MKRLTLAAAIMLTAGCASTPPSDAQWQALTAMAAPLEVSLPGPDGTQYRMQTANPAAAQALATLHQADARVEWARIAVQAVLGGAQVWAGIQGGRDARRAATASSAAMWGGIQGIVGGVQGNTTTTISDSHNTTETGLDPTVVTQPSPVIVTQPAPLVVQQPEPVIVDPHVVTQTDRDHSSESYRETTQSPPVIVTQPPPVVQPDPVIVRPEIVNAPPAQIIYTPQ